MLWPLLGWSVLLDCETELRLVISFLFIFLIFLIFFFILRYRATGVFGEEKKQKRGDSLIDERGDWRFFDVFDVFDVIYEFLEPCD